VPYRIELSAISEDTVDRLIELGALDVEASRDGEVAALMPDGVTPEQLARALDVDRVLISPAMARDDGSIWVLSPREVRIGRLRIVPAHVKEPDALRLIDSAAFGTGLHPTTALCVEALEEAIDADRPAALLDVGTGSGILALAGLMLGVPRALAIDIDEDALRVAAENARLNQLDDRLQLSHGGPEVVDGMWPLVVANILAAPLIEMAPALTRRIAHRGRLILSGIAESVGDDVERAYRRLGIRRVHATARGGWIALVMQAGW
jgi:ribosomal protein L11 methyltransferase